MILYDLKKLTVNILHEIAEGKYFEIITFINEINFVSLIRIETQSTDLIILADNDTSHCFTSR